MGHKKEQEEAKPQQTTPKKTFQNRFSILDDMQEGSDLQKSQFRGVFTCLYTLLFIFIIYKPISNYVNHGYIASPSIYNNFKHEFFLCLMTWPLYYAWSYLAFILQKLVLIGFPQAICNVLQHLTQSMMFIYSVYMTLSRDWCTTHATFCCFQACVHFMKMHSYTQQNKKLRRDYLKNNQQTTDDKQKDQYPNNVTFWNFTLFMWMPVLYYQTSYPRTEKVRYWYVFAKSLFTLCCIFALYILFTESIMPIAQQVEKVHFIEILLQFILPMGLFNIILFYTIFENILSVFAEITRFGDRLFYQDWWNSTSYEEYNRKWNRPVHLFLYHHVYLECLEEYRTSKFFAQLATFLFSACLHEWICAMVFRIVRPILFGFMLFQIPLFLMMKPVNKCFLGNLIFWIGWFTAPSIIVTWYLYSGSYLSSYLIFEYYK